MDTATLVMIGIAGLLAFVFLKPKLVGAFKVIAGTAGGPTTIQLPTVQVTPNVQLLTDAQVAEEYLRRIEAQAKASLMGKIQGEITAAALNRLTPISSALPVAPAVHPAEALAVPKGPSGVV